MNCPKCKSKDVVVISMKEIPGNKVMRVKGCNSCGHQFCTQEQIPNREGLGEEIRGLFEKALAYKRKLFDEDYPNSELGYTAVKREAIHLCNVMIPDCPTQKVVYEIEKHIRELRERREKK